ncbi:MAG TPA: hypothetical protein VNM15_10815 [Candidatus Binatia bacterium]|nr:hypothetical protein [Candidatus Binatia bacterium]
MASMNPQWKASHFSSLAVAFLLGAVILALPSIDSAQQLRTRDDLSRVLTVEKLSVVDGAVSGEIYNRSPHAVRDVQLLIRHTWLWDNEARPGKNDPGTSVYQTLSGEIPPGGRLPFKYQPSPPLPKMAGGQFETTVGIAGYAEIIPQSR